MSRERLLGSIRRGLDVHSAGSARRKAAEARLVEAVPHPRPAGTGGDLVQRFKDRQCSLGVEVIEVDAAEDIPAAIAAYLLRLALPARLRCGGIHYGLRCRGIARHPWWSTEVARRTATRQACHALLPVSLRQAPWPSLQAPTIR